MAKKLQILRGTTAQNNAYTGSVGELTMDTEKVEVRIHDGITQGGKAIGSGGANLPILTHVFSDHKLNDISWLNADTFSWQSGDVYVAAYEHLLDDFENRVGKGTDSDGWLSETIDGVTVYYVAAPDGHKICVQDNEANVQALYEKTGVAWYYILDKANKQFKLPRTKFGFTGLRGTVGGYVPAGLPNITGETSVADGYQNTNQYIRAVSASGAFYLSNRTMYCSRGAAASSANTASPIMLDASRSNSIYGNSNTVQPKATQMYLYFYVGNFEREALEQTAGLNAEMFNDKADVSLLENKANTDLSNLTSVGKKQLGPKIYRVTGHLINSIADTVEGHGVAEVYLYPNGIALIEFSIQCTKSGTSTSYFDWGINRDLIHSLNPEIPIITPKGGNETYYGTNGSIAADRTGYGGTLTAVAQFWQPGRVYNLDGGVGGWPAGNFVVNQRVVGTAWGTYEI